MKLHSIQFWIGLFTLSISGGGGGSSSSSSSTTNEDNRSVVDNGSLNVNSSSGNNVNYTDGGAVEKALTFASDTASLVIGSQSETVNKVLDIGMKLITGALDTNAQSNDALAAAYTDAKGGSTQDRQIAMMGIAAAVATVYFMGKK